MISYLVLYVADIEKSCEFYTAIGFIVVKEKHGNGQDHYSIQCGSIIIELYPAINSRISSVRLGMTLNSINGNENNRIVSDPDGNKIDITYTKTPN